MNSRIKELIKKAKKGDRASAFELGEIFRKGEETKIDYDQARYYYHIAAKAGSIAAINNLGLCYEKENKFDVARQFYLIAEEKDPNPIYEFNLGNIYNKLGNKDESLRWFTLSADNGDEDAPREVEKLTGQKYQGTKQKQTTVSQATPQPSQNNSKLPPPNASQERKLTGQEKVNAMLKAATEGNIDMQYYCGSSYENGDNGFPINRQEAFKWYQKAATNGHTTAQCNLGVFYIEQGNIQEAIKWLTLSADKGLAMAQCNLGLLYKQSGNRDKARYYLSLAAKQGDEVAKAYLEAL